MNLDRRLLWPLLGLGAAIAVGIVIPYVTSPFLTRVITLGLIFGILAMGVDLLGGYGGHISIGSGGIMAAAAYGVGYMTRDGHSIATAVLVGLAVGLLFSVAFALMIWRTTGVQFVMVTLAQGMIIWALAMRYVKVTGGESGISGITRPEALAENWKYYYFCLAVVVIVGLMLRAVTRTRFGLALRGLRDQEPRLRALGFNPGQVRFTGYLTMGACASVAGVLLAYYNGFVTPTTANFTTSAKAVTAVILGGVGTLIGPLVGAVAIALMENELSVYFTRWTTVLGTLFVLAILFAPNGLVGLLRSGVHRVGELRSRGAGEPVASDDAPPEGDGAGAEVEAGPGLSGTESVQVEERIN
jgi:branched-chain amino acid transport system permease protein